MNPDMEKALVELIDKEAIRECIHRYCRAVDRADPDLLRTIYWPEAQERHGPFEGSVEKYVEFFMGFVGTQEIMQHSVGTIAIELDGDKAKVESYFFSHQRCLNAAGFLADIFMGGRYLDKMEKRGREWRTADRLVMFDWMREMPDAYDFKTEIFGFQPKPGSVGPDDPLYTWLGVSRQPPMTNNA